jgi:predicted Zn-ribbon and HTH transcriptional regulator
MPTKKEAIVELLKKNTDGLTVSEISKMLRFSRNTVAVYLAELKGEDALRIREVGMAKLHYLK